MADETDETRYSREKHEATEQAMQGITLRELRGLTEDELVRRYDVLMDPYTGLGSLGPEDYRAELDRRVTERQNQRLEELTETLVVLTHRLHRLTWWVVILTVALVVIEALRIVGIMP